MFPPVIDDPLEPHVHALLSNVEVPKTYDHWFSNRSLHYHFRYSEKHFDAQFLELFMFVSQRCITPFTLPVGAFRFLKSAFLYCFCLRKMRKGFDLSKTRRWSYIRPDRCAEISEFCPNYRLLISTNRTIHYINSILTSLLSVHYRYLSLNNLLD